MKSKLLSNPSNLIEGLEKKYPNATYELNWRNPLELLVGTIMAAQTKDVLVNQLTPKLFLKYPDAQAFADAEIDDINDLIQPIAFPRLKAEAIQQASQILVDRFQGKVPAKMEDLLQLPRVARKTANVVLNVAFQIPSGVIVDSHVQRVAQRMGLTVDKKPEKIETALMKLIPQKNWIHFGPALVLHGRYVCTNQQPKCSQCIFEKECPKIDVKPGELPMVERSKLVAKGSEGPQSFLPDSWSKVLEGEFQKDYFKKLHDFIKTERETKEVFPPENEVFTAFQLTPFENVRVLLLGQDPYHDNNQAHGLCFSVKPGITPPPSLKNMFKELKEDIGCAIPNHGYLTSWASQGMLMLNAVLTVRAHEANSHKDKGWETFTDAVIQTVNAKNDPVIFVLWGAYAQKKIKLIDVNRHVVIQSAHPSPLSAKNGFFGSKPYSKINQALQANGHPPINWELPKQV